MASYGYGLDKYIDSDQGYLFLANITSGRLFFKEVPSTVYNVPSIDWFKNNDLVYYAVDYPNPLVKRFPKMLKIASIKSTNIYCCIYIDDVDVVSGVPILPAMGEKIRLYVICGDEKGEKTNNNPLGLRIGSFNEFIAVDKVLFYEGTSSPITSHMFKSPWYLFFGTIDDLSSIYLFQGVQKIDDIELNVNPPSIDRYYKSTLALNTLDEYISTGQLDLINADNTRLTTDMLDSSPQTSTPSGGTGSYNLYSDNIDFPDLPTLGAANSGLVTLYNPTKAQLRQLSDWLWSVDLLDTLEKMFAQPMDLIVTLNIVPTEPYELGNMQEVKIGGVGTRINMQKVNNQYAVIDCGILNVKEFYGSALDYGQYTKASLYLPFCNVVQLKIDEIMDGQIHIRYHADLFNGTCVAFVKIIREGLNSVLYSFEGNMAVSIPLISRDFSNFYQSVAKTGVNALSGGFGLTDMLDSAINVMSSKPNINRSGGATSTGGLLGIKKPYLILERPIQSLASGYNRFVGYPSNITRYLYTLSGYTEIDEVISNNLNCTTDEETQIIDLLKNGVYL